MVASYSLAICLLNYIHDTMALLIDIKIILNYESVKAETLLLTPICLVHMVGMAQSTVNDL